ncbi:MAG: hypothetical protein AAF203_01725 [Pseudomonadota bacterium]
MKNVIKNIVLLLLATGLSMNAQAEDLLILKGKVPGQYVGKDKEKFYVGFVVLNPETRLVEMVTTKEAEVTALASTFSDPKTLELKVGGQWNAIYPGLIELHNHTKQNNIGVWGNAKGQFANRFEWRDWSLYKKAVSQNMNPWIGYGNPATCAAFRWSEIQEMVVGTTYMQGPSSCVSDFGIHRVEDSKAYAGSKLKGVQAPTDLISVQDMHFVWNNLRPTIEKIQKKAAKGSDEYRLAYEQAVADIVNEHCDLGTKMTAQKVREKVGLDLLKDQALLKKECTKNLPLPKHFVRYIYWVHKSVIGKKKYIETIRHNGNPDGTGSAIVAHLSEGRRTDDKYNHLVEYPMVKLLGLTGPHVNFVHAVGMSKSDLSEMAEQQMGVIWSPFSNLLLYGETLDINLAMNNGSGKPIMLALGSDWLPTGSKGPLEELKLAYAYAKKMKLGKAFEKSGSDSIAEALYKMVNENPAKMINHWQGTSGDIWENGEDKGGVGTIAVGAMGSVVVTSVKDNNPFENLVAEIWETDVNMVVVDGKIQYGNLGLLNKAGFSKDDYEILANGEHDMENIASDTSAPIIDPTVTPKPSKSDKEQILLDLAEFITDAADSDRTRGRVASDCGFTGDKRKGFVHQDTVISGKEKKLKAFYDSTGGDLNLDRFKYIQRLLGAGLMTQSRNRNNPAKGDPDYVVQDFTPLYTCNDPAHRERFVNFIETEMDENIANRNQLRKDQKHGNGPANLEKRYNL